MGGMRKTQRRHQLHFDDRNRALVDVLTGQRLAFLDADLNLDVWGKPVFVRRNGAEIVVGDDGAKAEIRPELDFREGLTRQDDGADAGAPRGATRPR